MKIRQKLLLGVLGVVLLFGIVGYVSVYKSQKSLERSIRRASMVLVQEALDKIDRDTYFRIEEMLFLSRGRKIQEVVIQSNQEFDQMSDRQAYINKKDKEWVSASKDVVTPFMQHLFDIEVSQELWKKMEFYKKKYGYKIFSEIFATNKYGVNVAQTGRTTDYKQDDEDWWQSGKKDGVYVSDVHHDKSSDTHSIDIGIRMEDEKGDFIGVLKAVLNIREIAGIINAVKRSSGYESTNIELLSKGGEVFYGTDKNTIFDAPALVLNEFKKKEKHTYYSVMAPPGADKKLIVYGHSHGYRDYKGLGWLLIIEYDAKEVFAPVARLKATLLGVSLLGVVFCILAGILFSRSISGPIVKLEKAAAEIGKGKLNVKVDVASEDEIGFLGRTFNQMVGHLKDQQERAEKRTKELTVLHEVSDLIPYTVDYQQLLKLVMESVFKIIDYDVCGALLFNRQAANIIIKPSYPESVQYVDEVKENLLCEFAKFRNKQIDIQPENVRIIPVEPDGGRSGTREFGELKSSFNAPLLIGGKVVGVLNFSSAQENLFSADEVKFIYTVTNQIANAIERLQAMISAEKSKMESMIESMLEGAIMLDARGNVAVLNPQAREMMGLASEGEIVSPVLNEQMKLVNLDAALEESRSGDTIIMREVIMPHNEWRVLQCTISPVGPKDKRIGTVIILRDVTKEKEIDAMKTEFISMVSHELRTPLSITKEGLNLMLDKVAGDITEKQEMILSAAKDNMDRLARLINNVLDVSKMEAGKIETRKERLNIVRLAEQVMSTFEMKAKEKDIDLRVRFSGENIDIFADRDKMIQVFTNLINNALKFTLEGSVEISGEARGDFVECIVADTGIGISKDDLTRTFVKFQQFGRTPGSGEKGTGLGLTIAKGIVEVHEGKIWVESELGVGTKFIFTLPKFTPESALKDFVDNGIKEAQRANTRMSLFAMTMESVKEGAKSFPESVRLSCLEGLENILRGEVHRQGDAVFRDLKGCFVTLTNCSKDHVDNVCGRFKKALDEYSAGEQLGKDIVLKVGAATYPNDAKNSVELLKKARGGIT